MTIILGEASAIPGELFTITKEPSGRTTMVAEASDVGYRSPLRIYDDACDVGIAIRSRRTGRVVRFYLAHEDNDRSGEDIAGWWFKPIAEDARKLSVKDRQIDVLIIND